MRERILVIDDDSSVTSVLKRGLGYEGYAVEVAGNGREGLEVARLRPPDLVLLDIMLPGIDGLEVCRRLRSEPVTFSRFLTESGCSVSKASRFATRTWLTVQRVPWPELPA